MINERISGSLLVELFFLVIFKQKQSFGAAEFFFGSETMKGGFGGKKERTRSTGKVGGRVVRGCFERGHVFLRGKFGDFSGRIRVFGWDFLEKVRIGGVEGNQI